MLIAGAVSALATIVLFVVRRRRLGGSEEAKRFQAALRSGEVPEDADREHWGEVLDDSIRWSRRFRVAIALLATLTVCLAALSALFVASSRFYALGLAVVFVLVAVTAERLARQNLRRARHLAEVL